MNIDAIQYIRANKLTEMNKDINLCNFFYRQRKDKEYLNKVIKELKECIKITTDKGILNKYKEELIFLNYLINN